MRQRGDRERALSRRDLNLLLLSAVAGAGCAGGVAALPPSGDGGARDRTTSDEAGLPAAEMPPAEPREFRAAWIATVANIDWPSRPGLPAAMQRAEAIGMLERALALNLNALILQVRPAGDAVYPSALEPWTEYLSGAQGKPPYSGKEAAGEAAAWDPLAFWVHEAHRRGLELHAWFNPFRARHPSAKSPAVAPHVSVSRPQWVRRYGDLQWMDPGDSAAAAHTLAVIDDVVRRYDIDGVHIDDYFYPYPVPQQPGGPDLPFPDDEPWVRFLQGGGTRSREDWRRENVSSLVKAIHERIKSIKPWVSFGISPFGLPRPDRRPAGIAGFSQYDKLYADVERWLEQGWLDYFVPQLYWPIERTEQAFPVLLDAWIGENKQGRHLWPGLFTSQVRPSAQDAIGPRAWPAREITDQVSEVRKRGPAAAGQVHFSMVALMQDRDGVATLLRFGPYATPALVPATPWLALPAPPAAKLVRGRGGIRIDIGTREAARVARWALWRRSVGRWRFDVLPAQERIVDPAGADTIVLAAVGRNGAVGPRAVLRWGNAEAAP